MHELMFRDGGRVAPYVDCFGLVHIVYARELGITLPVWPELTLDDITSSGQSLRDGCFTTGFEAVQTGFERAFDVAVIRRPLPVHNRLMRGWWHVGVVSEPGFILHMDMAQGVVNVPFRDTAQSRASSTLTARDVMIYRHESRTEALRLQEACA
jgi:hypothetical protein